MANPDFRLEELTQKLRRRGYRITPQRMAVLRILAHSDDHPSAELIHERVKADFPMTSLGTVYKTISMLKDIGEILELGFSNDGNRYDGNRPYPHPHLICIRCKKISDLEFGALGELPQEVSKRTGYQIVTHRLVFYGVCPQCQGLA